MAQEITLAQPLEQLTVNTPAGLLVLCFDNDTVYVTGPYGAAVEVSDDSCPTARFTTPPRHRYTGWANGLDNRVR